MSLFNEQINEIIWLAVALIALVPFFVFLVGYLRVKSTKILITAVAFFLFFVKAMILLMKWYVQNFDDETWWSIAALLDIAIISLIAYSLSRKT